MTAAAGLPIRHVEECMGTVFSFDIRQPGLDYVAFEGVLRWLHETDARFSTYRADSQIRRIRDRRLTVAEAHPDVRTVLARCDELATMTRGYFTSFPDGRLDPSGYVKGWAIGVASQLLATAGSANHCVNGGGDVTCHGRPVAGRNWRVGIADPRTPGELLCAVQRAGPFAVATSGSSERGAHIVDPHTGERPCALRSVTVVARNIAQADVVATAAVAMGAGGESWLRTLDVDAIVVHADGRVTRIVRPEPNVTAAAPSVLLR